MEIDRDKKTKTGLLKSHWKKIVLAGGLLGLVFVELSHYFRDKTHLAIGAVLIFASLVLFLKMRNED